MFGLSDQQGMTCLSVCLTELECAGLSFWLWQNLLQTQKSIPETKPATVLKKGPCCLLYEWPFSSAHVSSNVLQFFFISISKFLGHLPGA